VVTLRAQIEAIRAFPVAPTSAEVDPVYALARRSTT
jgi:hypothetical protein